MSNQLPQFQSKDKIKILLIEDDQPTIDVYKMRFDVADFETIILKKRRRGSRVGKNLQDKTGYCNFRFDAPGN